MGGNVDEQPILGIIGGSGLYGMRELEGVEERSIDTPFGSPSSPLLVGRLHDRPVVFLARHGVGHVLSPGEVNYRANIYALKTLGVRRILSVSACGSLREDYSPGEIVIPDQLYDHTTQRARTFFSGGLVVHLSVPDPFCSRLSDQLEQSSRKVGARVHRGGWYITIDGPRFSTRAESNTYRAWGMSIIGMTTSPEAFLAREAEMCYAVMAHVTDYDVWRHSEDDVTAEMVFKTVVENTALAQRALADLVEGLDDAEDCSCQHALQGAISTTPEKISPEARERLSLLVDRYL
jgi:5'-methylthioadenosine phosphorylase